MQLNRNKQIRSILVDGLKYWEQKLDEDKENVKAIGNVREYKNDIIKIDNEIAQLKYK